MEIKDERVLSAKAKLDEMTERFIQAQSAKFKATNEYAATVQQVLEEKAVDNDGKIKSLKGEVFFFGSARVSYGNIEIIVHPVKKDGTRSGNHRVMWISDFIETL